MSTPTFPQSFHTTRWTLVRQAAGSEEPAAAQALSALCESYWYPVYAFIRRSGKGPHDAEDLTQGFFARLIEKNFLATADGD
jgi:DNA-directed RNA polymerase specialized sigma24 family protein